MLKNNLKKINRIVSRINDLEYKYSSMTDEELKSMTNKFKDDLKKGIKVDDLLDDAFAVAREASKRTIGLRHFDVQLIGGIVLHNGDIAEMKTGEGKTLVAVCPAYLNALTGKSVHIITVNEYLAQRDKDTMSKVFNFLGLTTGVILSSQNLNTKKEQYKCDIVYGTNSEFGFDYLRNNMVLKKEDKIQGELNFAIIDEADSILIDEARIPLIITEPNEKPSALYIDTDKFVKTLKSEDYIINEKDKAIMLTDEGITKVEEYFKLDNYMDIENLELSHHISQALNANYMMKENIDYIVLNGKIKIVDTFTGRIMNGKRYSQGLHQAIEAKENVEILKESKICATITYQNFFRMYDKISGMTGTAKTEEEEFKTIYKMKVICIPTNKPIQRIDNQDIVYKNLKIKTKALVQEIRTRYEKGQPILVGTTSIESSEYISKELHKEGIPHQILNAKYHEKEAAIIAQAGRYKAVTIATNMAGRGTDILLGGNAVFLAKQSLLNEGYTEDEIKILDRNEAKNINEYDEEFIKKINKDYLEELSKQNEECLKNNKKVLEVGGLCIIGTERHESRRIDDQLRGRSGRQGDFGESRFFISLEDDLIRIFGGDAIHNMIDRLGMNENLPLEASILAKSVRNAQKRVESSNFAMRKYLLSYDDVINIQREIIYKERDSILYAENLNKIFYVIADLYLEELLNKYINNSKKIYKNDIEEVLLEFKTLIEIEDIDYDYISSIKNKAQLKNYLLSIIKTIYENKEIENKDNNFNELVRKILLSVIDMYWMAHIEDMEVLQQGINLRAVGQQDPKQVYAIEGSIKYQEMNTLIRKEIISRLCSS